VKATAIEELLPVENVDKVVFSAVWERCRTSTRVLSPISRKSTYLNVTVARLIPQFHAERLAIEPKTTERDCCRLIRATDGTGSPIARAVPDETSDFLSLIVQKYLSGTKHVPIVLYLTYEIFRDVLSGEHY
jgi:hypothetical protein